MPTSGGLHFAITGGHAIGCEAVQIFTKSPQQWKAKELTDEQVAAFRQASVTTGVPCLASHDSYLINPASADEELLQKSREALIHEIERCTRLGIPFVVMHQGAIGKGTSEADALQRLADSVKYALDNTPADSAMLLLETTAGQGSCLGYRFEQVQQVLDAVNAPERLNVCMDTCHLFAAGYDLRTPETYATTMQEFDERIGLARVKMIHANDSKKELGSRVDRHEHVGQGHLGAEAFRLLLADTRLDHAPLLLETPKEGDMDPINLAALRQAAGL